MSRQKIKRFKIKKLDNEERNKARNKKRAKKRSKAYYRYGEKTKDSDGITRYSFSKK